MADLWKECIRWLIDCEVLPKEHRVTHPNAQVIDLAYTLRDGLVLCRLASNLDPSSINLRDISSRPQMSQFLCMKNIKLFLSACREFGVNDKDLFDPSMLCDFTNFGKVVLTLSAVSKSRQAREKNLTPFPQSSRVAPDENIYKNLDEVADHHFPPNNAGRLDSAYDRLRIHYDHTGAVYTSDREEDVYEDICYITFKQTEVPSVAQTPRNKRDHCMRELVETEKGYVEALRMLKQQFMKKLAPHLPEAKLNVIFLKIKELLEIHTGFYAQLCQACQDETDPNSPATLSKLGRPGSFEVPSRISDVFLRWKEKLVIYGEYIENLTRAQETIDELCASEPSIKEQLLKCELEAKEGKFKLRDVLTVPMQRVLKYHLLLDQLIKNTSPDHDDYDGLKKAYNAIRDLNDYLNEVKRDSDDLQAVHDILLSIEGDNIAAHGGSSDPKRFGRHVRDGELKVLFHDNNSKKIRYIFVFDKVLLICKASRRFSTLLRSSKHSEAEDEHLVTQGEQYACKDLLLLSDYRVDEAQKDGSKKGDGKGSWTWSWLLVKRDDSIAITMYAKTEQERKQWLNALKNSVERINPADARRAGHNFVISTTEPGENCKHCSLLLKGLVYQGYRCSMCSILVHKQCMDKLTTYCGRPDPPPRRDDMLISPSGVLPPRPMISPTLPSPINPMGSIEDGLQSYDWFQGRMSRPEATQRLSAKFVPPGTFMVRLSMDKPDMAISVRNRDDGKVRHMRVATRDEFSLNGTRDRLFFLSDAHYFKSMYELIDWYKVHSLCESFVELDITLQKTYRDILNNLTEVICDYSCPIGEDGDEDDVSIRNVLTLTAGTQVAVLDKKYDSQGWWLVHGQNQTGYFPKSHLNQRPA